MGAWVRFLTTPPFAMLKALPIVLLAMSTVCFLMAMAG